MKIKLQPFVELLLGAYFTVSMIALLREGLYVSVPFFILFQFGFLYIGATSLLQSGWSKISLRQVRYFMHSRLFYLKKGIVSPEQN